MTRFLKLALLALCLAAAPALASESHPANAEHAGHGSHDFHAATFFGAVSNTAETTAAIGLDLEYKLSAMNQLLGVGPIVEFTMGAPMETLAALGVFAHPIEKLNFVAAPGLQFADGNKTFVMRVGVGYDLLVGDKWTMAPNFNVDIASGHRSYVYGMSLGMGF